MRRSDVPHPSGGADVPRLSREEEPVPNGDDDDDAWGCDDRRDDGRRQRRHLQDLVVRGRPGGSAPAARLLRPAARQATSRRAPEDDECPACPARPPAAGPAAAGVGHGAALPFGHPLPAGRGGRPERGRPAAAGGRAGAEGAGGREGRLLVRPEQRLPPAGARLGESRPVPQGEGGGGAPLQSAPDPAGGHDGAARRPTCTLPLERAPPAGGDLGRDVLVHQQRRFRPVRHRRRGRGRGGRGGGGGRGRVVVQRVRPQLPFEPPAVETPAAQTALRVLGVRRLLPGSACSRAPQGGARTLVRGRGKHLRERLRQRTGSGALCRRRDGKAVVDASAYLTNKRKFPQKERDLFAVEMSP